MAKARKNIWAIVVSFLAGILAVAFGLAFQKDKTKPASQDMPKPETEALQAKEAIRKAQKEAEDRRKALKDRFSKIVPFVFLLISFNLFGAYVVWDPEDNVNRDYGSITNYAKYLAADRSELLKQVDNLQRWTNIDRMQVSIIASLKEENKRLQPSKLEKFWDQIKTPIAFIAGFVFGFEMLKFLK